MALQDVLIDELRDMYSAENQLIKSMPKLAKGANSKELKELFKEHQEQTKNQVVRLREVFEHLGKKPTGKHCNGMEGVIEEGLEALEEDAEGASFDSGIIGAALRTEHYEVAGYHACIAMAKTLGMREVVDLLKESLEEEVGMAKKIQASAKDIFKQASQEEEEEEKPASKKSAKEKTSERKSKEDEQQAGAETAKAKKGTKKVATKAPDQDTPAEDEAE